MAVATKAVVAICVVDVPAAAVGAVGTPVSAGDTLSTTVLPVPVVAAAEMAVPFPDKTVPVMVVESVIAGVVVGVATEPFSPLAETTETLVTVPEPPPPAPGWLIPGPTTPGPGTIDGPR